MQEQVLEDQIATLMRKNRRYREGYTYTVPSPEHYPFQWFWDSCFHAIILSKLNPKLAEAELRSVVARPLANGLIPHMIYWDESYRTIKWGREYQGDLLSSAWGTDGVSSITQPPLLAIAVMEVYRASGNRGFLRELYPSLRAHYFALLTDRSFSAHGLLGIINPDESGEDNSPRFDGVQGLPVRHSPLDNFRKRLELAERHATCQFDALNCTRHRFWVEDVSFNAISVRALETMAMIAREIEEVTESLLFTLSARQIRTSMDLHMKQGYRHFSLVGESQTKIRVETWAMFMPLYAGLLHKDEAKLLIERHLLNRDAFFLDFPIPSVAHYEDSYTDDDLWRGPTWIAVNWFIYHGLQYYGYDDLARVLREKTIELLAESGFREHYSARTGKGYGAHDFTWGGLVLDMR